MSVHDNYRRTATLRRANVIRALRQNLDPADPYGAPQRLRAVIEGLPDARMIVSGDIDGLVTAAMLGEVTGWKIAAVIVKSETVWLHQDYNDLAALSESGSAFGVDVFSTLFPNISNHVVLLGRRRLGRLEEAADALAAYDEAVHALAADRLFVNASLWAGIQSTADATENPLSARYRYPLGAAQIALAVLELAGLAPRFFDREYLPWLVANCDGGVESIRRHYFNVPMWWAALAGAVGPGSMSEQLYRLVSEQQAMDFVSIDRRLRYEEADRVADALTDDWNLSAPRPDVVTSVVRWIEDISGWPDPFLGGVGSLQEEWRLDFRPRRGFMPLSGLPDGLEGLQTHLTESLNAVHTATSMFDQRWRLGWMSGEEETS